MSLIESAVMIPALFLVTPMQSAQHYFEFPGEVVSYSNKLPEHASYEAMKLTLSRKNRQTIIITASNPGTLPILVSTVGRSYWLEAEKDGRWKPIEYVYRGFVCGTGAQTILFPPQASTSTSYTFLPGKYNTEIRLGVLTEEGPVYSNSIPGKISPTMFELDAEMAKNYFINDTSGRPDLDYREPVINP
jgi:hypothetical protein